ncbi:MAG: hypothetical protein ACR2JB_19100 [Bryobacteraceae bacterium]
MTKQITEKEPPRTLDQVRERLEQISSHRSQLVASRMNLNNRLEGSRQDAARKYLGGDRSGVLEANTIGAELQTIETALEILNADQKAADIDLERAKAADLRAQAGRKRAKLDSLNAETGALLAKLSALEGVTFTHSILSSQPVLGNLGMMADPLTYKSPDPWVPIFALAVNNPSGRIAYAPKSIELREEIKKLEGEAVSIENKLAAGQIRRSAPGRNKTFLEMEAPGAPNPFAALEA